MGIETEVRIAARSQSIISVGPLADEWPTRCEGCGSTWYTFRKPKPEHRIQERRAQWGLARLILVGRTSVRIHTVKEGDLNEKWHDTALMLMETIEPLDIPAHQAEQVK